MARRNDGGRRFCAGSRARGAGTIAGLALLIHCATLGVGHCQSDPADGSIGVYFDAAGTQSCGIVPRFATTDLHVIATLAGRTSPGITGVEFRLEFSDPTGYFVLFIPVPCACLVIGNPLDLTACVDDAAGFNFAFPECQNPDPIAGAGRVFLGNIRIFNAGGGPLTIETKRRNPASNPSFNCPLFVRCDAPSFTPVCMTLQDGDPLLGGLEPYSFRTVVNAADCLGPPDCVRIGVEARPWSLVKTLYRNAGR